RHRAVAGADLHEGAARTEEPGEKSERALGRRGAPAELARVHALLQHRVVRHAAQQLVVDLHVERRPLLDRRGAQALGELALDEIVLAQLLARARGRALRQARGEERQRKPEDVGDQHGAASYGWLSRY